jgi:hypothetical protein
MERTKEERERKRTTALTNINRSIHFIYLRRRDKEKKFILTLKIKIIDICFIILLC